LAWEPDDRDKLRAYLLERSQRCTMCGTAGWEWDADRYAYEPKVEICMGCQMKDLMREEASSPGSSIILVPKERAQAMREHPKQSARRAPRAAQ
jgi:hypothetical protein